MKSSDASYTVTWHAPSRRSRFKSQWTKLRNAASNVFKMGCFRSSQNASDILVPIFDQVSAVDERTSTTNGNFRRTDVVPRHTRNETPAEIRHNSPTPHTFRGHNRGEQLERQVRIEDIAADADAVPKDKPFVASPLISDSASKESRRDLLLSQAEVTRTILEIEAKIAKENSHNSSRVTNPNPRQQPYSAKPSAQGQSSKLGLSQRNETDETDSVTPCDAPLLNNLRVGSQDSSFHKDMIYEQTLDEMVNMPRINQRIRFSRRDKASVIGDKARADDPVLSYRSQEKTEAVHETKISDATNHELSRTLPTNFRKQGTLTHRALSTSISMDRETDIPGQIQAEVHSYMQDVTQAAETAKNATKKRSDLFVERVLLLERRSMEIQRKSEIKNILEKVDDCERQNKELTESLRRTRELFAAVCRPK